MRTKTDRFNPSALVLFFTRHLRPLPAVHIFLSPPSALELCTRSSVSYVIFMLKSSLPVPSSLAGNANQLKLAPRASEGDE
jgi:hypothetical protein